MISCELIELYRVDDCVDGEILVISFELIELFFRVDCVGEILVILIELIELTYRVDCVDEILVIFIFFELLFALFIIPITKYYIVYSYSCAYLHHQILFLPMGILLRQHHG